MSTKGTIELVVKFHPSGNRTLEKRLLEPQRQPLFSNVLETGLMVNYNKDWFYREVSRYLTELSKQGYKIIYIDDYIDE